MNYDIYLRDGDSDSGANLPNPTYNLTPIFDLALTGEPLPNHDVSEARVVLLREKTDRPRGLRLLSGRVAADTVPQMVSALRRLSDPKWRSRFVALEPSNGWGKLPDAIRVMRELLKAAQQHPEMTWEIH